MMRGLASAHLAGVSFPLTSLYNFLPLTHHHLCLFPACAVPCGTIASQLEAVARKSLRTIRNVLVTQALFVSPLIPCTSPRILRHTGSGSAPQGKTHCTLCVCIYKKVCVCMHGCTCEKGRLVPRHKGVALTFI